jgi:purine-binding chemotaxis protein CheW
MTDERAIVAVRIGQAEFGLPVEMVRAVMRPHPVTRVPHPDAGLRGLTSVHGGILPVVDLGARLGLAPVVPPGRFVVAGGADLRSPVVLWVDAVLGLVELGEPLMPPEEARAALDPHLLLGVTAPTAERLISVIDLTSVLANEPLARESA